MVKYLITGSFGFVGANRVPHLREHSGCEITILDDSSNPGGDSGLNEGIRPIVNFDIDTKGTFNILEAMRRDAEYDVDHRDFRTGELKHTCCNSAKATNSFDFQPSTSLSLGEKRTRDCNTDNQRPDL